MSKTYLKWVGAKNKSISFLEEEIPEKIKKSKQINCYIEPFVGGGAFLLHLLSNYKLDHVFASDLNLDLINTWKTIQDKTKLDALLVQLAKLDSMYKSTESMDEKNKIFKTVKKEFNALKAPFNLDEEIKKAAYLIFLNKTCFNGLHRVNKLGEYNTSFGKRKSPKIFDATQLSEISKLIQPVHFYYADYTFTNSLLQKYPDAFIYLDPPYRKITKGSFKEYTKEHFVFSDYLDFLSKLKTNWLASDSAFENYSLSYKDFNVKEIKVLNSLKRQTNNELVIKNY
jgi:DNA adenine methylase